MGGAPSVPDFQKLFDDFLELHCELDPMHHESMYMMCAAFVQYTLLVAPTSFTSVSLIGERLYKPQDVVMRCARARGCVTLGYDRPGQTMGVSYLSGVRLKSVPGTTVTAAP